MLARVALDTPVLPPLELLLEPARELLVLVVGLGDLALAAELGQDVGPPRRRGLRLRSFLDRLSFYQAWRPVGRGPARAPLPR